jgi:hypothetical protein
MDSIISIIEILSRNIGKHSEDLKIEFKERVKAFNHLADVRDFINFEHALHSESYIKINNCDKYHCLECLESQIELKNCSHGNPFTSYEMFYIPSLVEGLTTMNDLRQKKFQCHLCKQEFNYTEIEESSKGCECRVCNLCFLDKYLGREIKCVICLRDITEENISPIAEQNNVDDFEAFLECNSCHLIYPKSVVYEAFCYLCSENKKMNKN